MTVKQRQCLLTYLGYDTGGVDGIWGAKSITATEAFQNDHGLGPDGIFGPGTEKKILEVIASGEQPIQQPQSTPETGNGEDFWADIQYFKRAEFRCPCPRCGGFPAEPDEQLVKLADQVRGHFGVPATVSSGVRCQAHNAEVGGVSSSRHLLGKAVDFSLRGLSSDTVLGYVGKLPGVHYAYAIDGSYVHMDVQ